jgi:DNA-binding SARP family transcriptional activator
MPILLSDTRAWGDAVHVLLLGSAAIVDRERTHALGSARQATVLAVLVSRAGHWVPVDRLVGALWGEDPPATARNTLQVHVSALRRLMRADAIESGRESYRFSGEPLDVDVLRFEQLARRGREAVGERPAEAARLLRAALSLYRGDLLAGVPTLPAVEIERERLRRLYAMARLARVDADLALGRHLLVVDELMDLAAERPYDEEVAARLVLALYRAGAQVEALDVFGDLARRLHEDFGVAPSERVRALQQQVLRHDESLALAPRSSAAWRAPLERPADQLVGREALLLRLETELDADRVHTLVGPSGVGKTRIATELAVRCQAMYPDGAVLVALAGVSEPEAVLGRLVDALSADLTGALSEPDEPARVAARAQALVILDGLVTTPEVRARLDEVVACSTCTFVVTSARPSGLRSERIWSVPALDDEAAAELLLVRARHAGADLPDDAESRAVAIECARLVDRLPLAIELVAPLAVSGLDELLRILARGSRGAAGRISFTSSLDRLGAEETELVDFLATALYPVDAELVDDAGLVEFLAPLVRDGIAVRTPGPHGRRVYTLVGALGNHVRDTRRSERQADSVRRLVAVLAATTGSPRQYLPMHAADPSLCRRLVALEPVLVRAVGFAREADLVAAGADIALLLPELHYATHENPPPLGRADWLLGRDDLDPGRRIDLLVSEATTAVAHNQTADARRRLREALELAREREDAGRTAVVLAQLAIAQLLLTADLGSDVESEREAVRLAESTRDPVILAATLCLLYPTKSTPDDLADTLERSLAAARSREHVGLVLMALANLSMAALDRGRPGAAAVHARECAALAADLHHRGLVRIMLDIAETGELLSGNRSSVRCIAQSVAHAARNRDLRRLTEGLLRFAAGLHRVGRQDEAARARGLYHALLVEAAVGATASEVEFATRWLDGVRALAPQSPVHEGALLLVREVEASIPEPSANLQRLSPS